MQMQIQMQMQVQGQEAGDTTTRSSALVQGADEVDEGFLMQDARRTSKQVKRRRRGRF